MRCATCIAIFLVVASLVGTSGQTIMCNSKATTVRHPLSIIACSMASANRSAPCRLRRRATSCPSRVTPPQSPECLPNARHRTHRTRVLEHANYCPTLISSNEGRGHLEDQLNFPQHDYHRGHPHPGARAPFSLVPTNTMHVSWTVSNSSPRMLDRRRRAIASHPDTQSGIATLEH